jgi:ABC-2 type transport system permease protein
MFAAVIIMVPLFVNGGLLFQSLTKEKEGRVMEILLASLRPLDLLAGKLLGVSGLMFLQYAAWALFAFMGLLLANEQLMPIIAGLSIESGELLLVGAFTAGGFFLYAGLMAGVGALAPDSEGSRAWLFLITLPMSVPIYLGASLASSPNSPVAVGLSLFPLSAPVTMLIRLAGSSVADWQVAASLILLSGCVVFVLWLMARLFRTQTLLSGEELSVSRIWSVLRTG